MWNFYYLNSCNIFLMFNFCWNWNYLEAKEWEEKNFFLFRIKTPGWWRQFYIGGRRVIRWRQLYIGGRRVIITEINFVDNNIFITFRCLWFCKFNCNFYFLRSTCKFRKVVNCINLMVINVYPLFCYSAI